MNKKPYDNFWGNLVATVCEEFQDGTLEFSDAVEDLLILGFDNDEARKRLQAVAAADLKRVAA